MNVKKVFLVVISALIMIVALITGITGSQDGEKEQFFQSQIFWGDAAIVQNSVQANVQTSENNRKGTLYLSEPNVLIITSLFLLASFAFSIYLAKENGLYIISRKKKQKQYEGNGLKKELQYDQ